MAALLSVEGLSVEYTVGELRAESVSNVSFEIDQAERVGLVGESGAGKSVVARAIMGLIRSPGRVTRGRVVFDGIDLTTARESVLDRIRGGQIALIPQDASQALNPVLRVGEQCEEVIRRHLRTSSADATRRARETMSRVGLADPDRVLTAYAHELSGGMKQRVVIAIALSCDPRLIIADDPTSAVDVTIQAQILKEFRDLTTRLGLAVLFISHDLRVISSLCSRVVVLYSGQVAEVGTSRDILAQPTHPYTAALLACAPTVEARVNPLPVVPGAPPDAFEEVRGCRFHPRCARRLERCATEAPHLLGKSHDVACWNPLVEAALEVTPT